MKLSYRFFCIAYIIVLLAMGIGGTLIIKNMNDTLWNARIEQTNTAASYATDSFLAFADISYSKITEVQKNDIIHQITNTLDGTIDSVEIYDSDSVGDKYGDLGVNEGLSRFIKEGDSTLLEAVCRVNTGSSDYYLAVYSDFTDIKSQSNFFWKSQGVF